MKKICFSLIVTLMITSIGFANSIEIKELNDLEMRSSTSKILNEVEDDALRFCYLMSTVVTEPVPGVIKTTKTYMCFDHPEFPGGGDVLIGN